MRINRYLAYRYGASRREADRAVEAGEVYVNQKTAIIGQIVDSTDHIIWAGHSPIKRSSAAVVLLNKPVGYVCSRTGQGSKTVYDLLPEEYAHLKIAGRLDKDSSGLTVLTAEGELIQNLTHPSEQKIKSYQLTIEPLFDPKHKETLMLGVDIGDEQPSRMMVTKHKGARVDVDISEGRNRQIRRTFEVLGYKVVKLHRYRLGPYTLENLKPGEYTLAKP